MSHLSSAVHSREGGGVMAAMWKASMGENLLLRESASLGRSEDWPPRTPELLVQSLSASRSNGQLVPSPSKLLWLWLYPHCGLLNVPHRHTASLNPRNLIRCGQLLNGTLKQSNQAMLKTVRNTIY